MTWFAGDSESQRNWTLGELEEKTIKLRRHSGYLDGDALELISLFEGLGIKVMPLSDAEMGGAKALACAGKEPIVNVTHKLFKGFQEGDPAARYEMGHELGHLVLHRGARPKALALEGSQHVKFVSPELSEEEQAWKYSRALFLPRAVLGLGRSNLTLSHEVGVPEEAVEKRFEEIKAFEVSRLPRTLPADLSDALQARRRQIDPRELALEREQRKQAGKMAAWQNCATFPGKEPISWRVTRGFLIKWSDFGREESHYGWTIFEGEARAFMDLSFR